MAAVGAAAAQQKNPEEIDLDMDGEDGSAGAGAAGVAEAAGEDDVEDEEEGIRLQRKAVPDAVCCLEGRKRLRGLRRRRRPLRSRWVRWSG